VSLSDIIKAIIDRERTEVPTAVRGWFTDRIINQFINEGLSDDIKQGTDQNLAYEFWQIVQIPGTSPADYRVKLIAMDEDEYVLASIQFANLEASRPFIEVEHRSFDLYSRQKVTDCAHQIALHFKVFDPEYVRFSDWTGALYGPDGNGIICENRLLAAPLNRLRMLPPPDQYHRIHLRQEYDLEFYPRYSDAYDAFHAERPDLKKPVFKEPRASMERYVKNEFVYSIFIDDQWAGVVTVIDHREWIFNGHMIADLILIPQFRAKGLGAAVQRCIIDTLDDFERNELMLMGTINPKNDAALKAAQSTGRVDLGGKYQVYLNGTP
jgi:hypothetical protein